MKMAKMISALIVLLIVAGLAFYMFGNYSDGYRAGTVIKLSRKGFLFKTYEGDLNLGMGIQDQNSQVSVSNIWPFSVKASDTASLRILGNAMMSGKRAKLHYREKFVTVPWRGDTKYQVYKVEMAE
ncbi:MAG: 6-phosphogluconate dehydrogenase [Fibrobacteres bacterium]|nr:6-phosphogluconate dehydrogenase [Fibrobacterota bacterium]